MKKFEETNTLVPCSGVEKIVETTIVGEEALIVLMTAASGWFSFCRPSNTGFGIWDLPQESSIKAKFGTLGLNWDFFGTIFIPFWDFESLFP